MVVSQAWVSEGSEDGVAAYLRFENRMFARYRDSVRDAGGLYAIHDWRTVRTYNSEARRYWQGEMKRRDKGYLRGSTVCVSRVTPLLKMAVQGANLVAGITGSGAVEIVGDLRVTLASIEPRVVDIDRGHAEP